MDISPLRRRLGSACLVGLAAGLPVGCSAPRASAATRPLSPAVSIPANPAAPEAVIGAAPASAVPPGDAGTDSARDLVWLSPGPLALAQSPSFEDYRIPKQSRPRWETGGARLQGYLGVTELTDVTRKMNGSDQVTANNDVTMPTIGGGGQWKLGGERIDWGLEGLLSIGGRGNVSALAAGGGGAVIAVNLDLLVVDFFGGPFMSFWLTNRVRFYGGAGPIVSFTNYSQDAETPAFSRNGSGFGTGWYGRAGTELLLGGGTSIGIGARFSDMRVDLDSGLGDLDLQGIQYMFTVTTGW